MVIGLEKCGCEIHQDHDARVHIEYCPKHKSASDLYEACKMLIHGIERDCVGKIEAFSIHKDSPFVDTFRKAISKAEGGK